MHHNMTSAISSIASFLYAFSKQSISCEYVIFEEKTSSCKSNCSRCYFSPFLCKINQYFFTHHEFNEVNIAVIVCVVNPESKKDKKKINQ